MMREEALSNVMLSVVVPVYNDIFGDMRKIAETTYTQLIRYYRENHGVITPWILLKGIYFATLVNFVRSFKVPQREKLVNALYSKKRTISGEELFVFVTIRCCIYVAFGVPRTPGRTQRMRGK